MMAPHTSEAARSDPTPSPFTGEGGGGGLPSHDTHTAQPSQPLSTGGITVTVNGEETEIVTKGRHDPCVGIRAVPVGEAMMACVLADHMLRHRGQVG